MPLRAIFCSAVVAAVVAAGCSDNASSDDITPACTQLATSLCAKAACGGPFAQFADPATCESLRTADCVAASKRPGVGYASTALTTCAQQLDAATCFDQWSVIEGAPCAFLYTGQLAEGAACQRAEQCASGSCSAAANQCGVCKAVAALGQSCTDLACAPHLRCESSLCVHLGTRGEACVTAGPGVKCDFPFACVSGACQDANAAEGAKCLFEADTCDTSLGLVCNTVADSDAGFADPNVGSCQQYVIEPAGQSCNAGGTACGPGITCVATTTDATCVVDPAEGAACDPKGAACLYPLACISGTCTKPLANACP